MKLLVILTISVLCNLSLSSTSLIQLDQDKEAGIDWTEILQQIGKGMDSFTGNVGNKQTCVPGERKAKDGFCIACPAGTYSSTTNATSCTKCAAGSFNPLSNQTSCQVCPAGSFSNKKGSDSCTPCAEGSFASKNGSKVCDLCAAGTYSNQTGSVLCNMCDPGSYANDTGSAVCKLCSKGSYASWNGSKVCDLCTAGSYSNYTGAVNCTLCAAGSYSNYSGTVNCTLCAAGSYSKYTGSVNCTLCAAGSYNNYTGSVNCTLCAAGSYSNYTGSVNCTLCAAGSYSNYTGSVNCTLCAAGSYSNHTGSVNCTLCAAGSATSDTGSTSCSLCKPGQFAHDSGSATCTSCSPGTFSTDSGSQDCTNCTAGSYQDKAGQTSCTECEKGSYQDKTGGSSCKQCRDSRTYTTYNSGSSSAEDCVGPLVRYTVGKSASVELTDVQTVSIGGFKTVVVESISGDWAVRMPEAPYSEYSIIKQGDRLVLSSTLDSLIIEPMIGNVFCYKDSEGHGQMFAGYQTKDQQGRHCESFCRNTDGDEIAPHCAVNGGKIPKSPCGIPKCVWDVKCSSGDGTGYRGSVNNVTTERGTVIACQAWNKNYPHFHLKFRPTARNIASYGLGNHNLCRNPDPGNTLEPWCYTSSFWIRWQLCGVTKCDDSFPYFQH